MPNAPSRKLLMLSRHEAPARTMLRYERVIQCRKGRLRRRAINAYITRILLLPFMQKTAILTFIPFGKRC